MRGAVMEQKGERMQSREWNTTKPHSHGEETQEKNQASIFRSMRPVQF